MGDADDDWLAGTADPHLRRIREVYPDLAIGRVRRDEGGQYNVVLIADEALVFRFPRFASGVARLRLEVALLDAVRPHVALPIPEPCYRSFARPEPGMAFAGYPLLPGAPMRRALVASIADDATLDRLALQLAAFLRDLHRVPLGALPRPLPLACGLAGESWREGWRRLAGRIRELVLPRLEPAAQSRVEGDFAAFLDDDAQFADPPTLIHGDFGTGNILYDPARGAIGGIIDFGSAGLGDPACDLAALLTYGEAFVARGLPAYPELAALLPRARFYRGTFALQEALYGVEHGDEAAIARGIAPDTHAGGQER